MFKKLRESGGAFLIVLSVAYFVIGIFSIYSVGLAGDETAHLGAAHSYIYGHGVNVEHPTLLKNLNAGVLAIFFNDYSTENREQWSRGVDYQLNSSHESSDILQASRFVYLVFNAGFLIFLWYFGWKNKILDPIFSWILGVFYVFSPSFFSHNFLLTFDVAAGWTSFVVLLATLNLMQDAKTTPKQFWIKSWILSLALFLALGVKFSNFVWVGILLGVSFFSGVYLTYHQNDKALKRLLQSFGLVSFSNLSAIWVMNFIAFRSEFHWGIRQFWNPILYPIFAFIRGLVMTVGRSDHTQPNFIDDRFVVIPYNQFVGRVFWFKENPILIAILGLSLVLLTFWLSQNFKAIKNFQFTQKNIQDYLQKNLFQISKTVLIFSFPFLYLIASWDSKLTIGYRHFYPVLIFIYAILAYVLTKSWVNKMIKYLVTFLVFLYAVFGILAVPQGISYTNFLWTQPKWKLTTDSTINWDQEQAAAFKYLSEEGLFKTTDPNPATGRNWNTALAISGGPNINIALQEIIGQNQKLEDFWEPFVDLREEKIEDLDEQYLLVDSNVIQWLSDDGGEVAKKNLDYILTAEPIFERNEIMFIFEV